MDWRDDGIVLSTRKLGENSVRLSVLTRDYGRHAGLVRGGRSKAMRPILQPGNRIRAVWRARLESHLGGFAVEAEDLSAGVLMEDPLALSGLNAACAMASTTTAALAARRPLARTFCGARQGGSWRRPAAFEGACDVLTGDHSCPPSARRGASW